MADTELNQPPPDPVQNYPNQQPPPDPQPPGYGNAQPQYQTPQPTGQGPYVPVQGSYSPQVPSPGQYYYPQQQPQVQPVFIPVQQPPVIYTQPMMVTGGQCNPGQHIFRVHYGTCGIIAAIVLFPIGLLFLFADQEKRCIRCGMAA